MDNYTKIEKIGEGTYGKVYKGRRNSTLDLVAMKKVQLDMSEGIPKSYLREISMLKELVHENIIKLEEVVWDEDQMYLIFEYLPMDLREYMDYYECRGMSIEMLRCYLYQIAQSLMFCHQRRILHRDLKPENLLIHSNGTVKLADFGLGRTISAPVRKTYTPIVVTIWYRAPELLLGDKTYAGHLDIWSLGCVMAEMATSYPLFDGDSEVDQLIKIFRVIPTTHLDAVTSGAERNKKSEVPANLPKNDINRLPEKIQLPDDAYNLLESMLKPVPNARISAKKILKHGFFTDFDRILVIPKFANSANSSNGSDSSSGSLAE